jgi:hypothetical protein
MEQSAALETNRPSASQGIPCIWYKKKTLTAHVSPPTLILSQINPVHALIPLFEDLF